VTRVAFSADREQGTLAVTRALTAVIATGVLSITSPAAGALHAAELPDSAQSGAASSVPEARDSVLFASPTTRDHIGRVVVQATVNGKGPFRFIVDTGATHSTITPDLVRALGLKPAAVPAIVLNGITGTVQVSAVTLDRLQTGDLIINGLVVPVVGTSVMAGADGMCKVN